jgi:hypothetical protein
MSPGIGPGKTDFPGKAHDPTVSGTIAGPQGNPMNRHLVVDSGAG